MADGRDRRERIVRTAAEMFASSGLHATTVRAIADAVGVLSGSLYHYFPSKDAILREVLTRHMDNIRVRYDAVTSRGGDPAGVLHDIVAASLEIAGEQPHATAIWQAESRHLCGKPEFAGVLAAAAGIQQTWLSVIEAGVADGSFRSDIPPWVFYRLLRDTILLSVRWHRRDDPYSTSQLAEDVTSLFLHGYAAVPA